MSTNQLDPTYYVLKLFRAAGVHPHAKVTLLIWFYFCMNCILVSAVIALASYGVVFGIRNDDINQVVECLQTTLIYVHILGKYISLFNNKKILSELLEQRSRFLRLDSFDFEIRTRYETLLMHTYHFVNIFLFLTSSVVFLFYLQPYLTGGDLPVSVYIPEGWYYYILFGFFPLAPSIVAAIYGSDALFCAISVPIIIQFKLLSHQIKSWKLEPTSKSIEGFKRKLKRLVDHQNFLFDYCVVVNRFNNGIFLNQFLLSVGIICVQLFVVSQDGFKLPNKLKCLNYSFMEIVEIGIYCFNAELISDASEEVGNTIYNAEWYETSDLELRQLLGVVIARTQKRVNFSGFGLVWINVKTFTQIFKTALSFYSYLHNLVLD